MEFDLRSALVASVTDVSLDDLGERFLSGTLMRRTSFYRLKFALWSGWKNRAL